MQQLIVGNWKSNKNVAETQEWLAGWQSQLTPEILSDLVVVVAPPLPLLPIIAEWQAAHPAAAPLSLAVQDISPYPSGSYTGAVSTATLASWPVSYAIVGHSERRQYFAETHQQVANKVSQAVEAGWQPIVCIDTEYAAAQAAALEPGLLAKCVIAYEPVESIGSGHPQPVEDVSKNLTELRRHFPHNQVIYGGSVNPDNITQYLAVTDGVLVGHASLDIQEWVALLKAARA